MRNTKIKPKRARSSKKTDGEKKKKVTRVITVIVCSSQLSWPGSVSERSGEHLAATSHMFPPQFCWNKIPAIDDNHSSWLGRLESRSRACASFGTSQVRPRPYQYFYTFYCTRSLCFYVYLFSAQVKCLWWLADQISTTVFRYKIRTDLSISLLYYFMCAPLGTR